MPQILPLIFGRIYGMLAWGEDMTTYRKMYIHLVGTIENAVEELERGEVVRGMQRLIAALQEAEDQVMEMDIIPDENGCRLCRFPERPAERSTKTDAEF